MGNFCLSEQLERYGEAAGGDMVKAPPTFLMWPVCQAPGSW